MKKMIILNHKMNLLYNELDKYIDNINKIKYSDIIICPTSLYIDKFIKESKYQIGIQNIDSNTIGYNTSLISLKQVKSMNIKYILVGHSETLESYEDSNLKIKWITDEKMIPIICLGEREKINSIYELHEKILCKIEKLFNNINLENEIIIAYEPYWAVGSGQIPNINQIEDIIKYIKKVFYDKYKKIPKVLYGGSILKSNINNILNIDNIDGIMIGNVSSNIDAITEILNNIN